MTRYNTIRLSSLSRKIRQCRKDKDAEAAARAMRQEVDLDSVARTNMPKLSQGDIHYGLHYHMHYGVHYDVNYGIHYDIHYGNAERFALWYTKIF